jgi:hypothetical protein
VFSEIYIPEIPGEEEERYMVCDWVGWLRKELKLVEEQYQDVACD